MKVFETSGWLLTLALVTSSAAAQQPPAPPASPAPDGSAPAAPGTPAAPTTTGPAAATTPTTSARAAETVPATPPRAETGAAASPSVAPAAVEPELKAPSATPSAALSSEADFKTQAANSGSLKLAPQNMPTGEQPVAEVVDNSPPPYAGPLGTHQRHISAWVGVRNDYVRDTHYDLFATNDALPVLSVGLAGVFFATGNLSVAALGLWETGSRGASARGDSTDLRVRRLEVGAEGRYHLGYRAYALARLSLGPSYAHASVRGAVARGEMVSRGWLLTSAATLGGAFRVFGSQSGASRDLRLWLVGEGGYALTGTVPLRFEPNEDEDSLPERTQPVDLGELDLSAPLFRIAVVASY